MVPEKKKNVRCRTPCVDVVLCAYVGRLANMVKVFRRKFEKGVLFSYVPCIHHFLDDKSIVYAVLSATRAL